MAGKKKVETEVEELTPECNCEPGSPNKIADYHANATVQSTRTLASGEVMETWYCDTCRATWEMSAA